MNKNLLNILCVIIFLIITVIGIEGINIFEPTTVWSLALFTGLMMRYVLDILFDWIFGIEGK